MYLHVPKDRGGWKATTKLKFGAYGYQTQHRFYAILEANDYADVQALLSGAGHIRNGEVEVLPVNDLIANRKTFEEWGK